MRIAISHTDAEHPNATKFAYRLGRVQDGTDFVTGEDRSKEDIVAKLLEAAKKEYPEADGYTHEIETLVDGEDGNSKWVSADSVKQQSDFESYTPTQQGGVQEVQLEAPVTVRVTE